MCKEGSTEVQTNLLKKETRLRRVPEVEIVTPFSPPWVLSKANATLHIQLQVRITLSFQNYNFLPPRVGFRPLCSPSELEFVSSPNPFAHNSTLLAATTSLRPRRDSPRLSTTLRRVLPPISAPSRSHDALASAIPRPAERPRCDRRKGFRRRAKRLTRKRHFSYPNFSLFLYSLFFICGQEVTLCSS